MARAQSREGALHIKFLINKMLSRSQLAYRSFSRAPLIQFIGKRQPNDKTRGVYERAAPVSQAVLDAKSKGLKSLSPNSELSWVENRSDLPSRLHQRIPYSEQEIEAINNGGAEVDIDWKKVTLA